MAKKAALHIFSPGFRHPAGMVKVYDCHANGCLVKPVDFPPPRTPSQECPEKELNFFILVEYLKLGVLPETQAGKGENQPNL